METNKENKENIEEQEECKLAPAVRVFTTVKQFMSYVDNAKENLKIVKGGRIYDSHGNLKAIYDGPKFKNSHIS